MELVCKALEFDDSSKATAVNVRDAACYICWAFARGFGKDTLDYEILKTLAFKLVSTALFDRSVNVRRAAGAAFQENVGRNIFSKETEKFPEGIVLSTMIDYQAVARIELCYSSLCLEVANFGKYVHPLMESLLNVFSGHWDEKIRILAASAIQGLVKFDALYSVNILLPKFYEKLSSTDVDVKQGALMCLGSILKGLYESRVYKVEEIDLTKIKEIIPNFAKTFKSAYVHGSLLMLKAIGSFVEAFAATKLPLNDEELAEWHRIADRIIGDLNPQVRVIGKKAIKNIMEYYALDIDRSRKFMNVVKEYFPKLEAEEYEYTRVGAAIALGGIPAKLLKENITENKMLAVEIVEKLITVVEDEKFVHWIDARVAALNSIEKIISNVGITNFNISIIFVCLKRSIRDSTKTIHGLVGQHVRCAAISAFVQFLPLLEEAKMLKQETLDQIISLILEQCCERVDKLREFSAFQLRDLLQRHVLSNIVEREKLYSIFVNKKDIKWMIDAFEPLAPLLNCEFYHESILRGFINSVGGATGSWTQEKGLVKLEEFYRNNPEKANQLFQVFLNIFDEHHDKLIHLIIPVTAFGRLFSEGCFPQIEQEPDNFPSFVEVVKKISKIAYGGSVSVRNAALSSLATVFQTNLNSDTFKLAASTLMFLLTSRMPVIRSEAAKCFAQAVNVLDVTNDISMEELEEIYSLLKQTQWRDNESNFQEAAKRIQKEFNKVIENHRHK
uniref:Tubulin-specific chaperone D n=1 Tax=Panagrolaimus superbus TaxID=310955 RepID=A0A914Y3C6_9BILA